VELVEYGCYFILGVCAVGFTLGAHLWYNDIKWARQLRQWEREYNRPLQMRQEALYEVLDSEDRVIATYR
jgi:hypothetical protein